jgi:hypothetical protein
MALNHSIGGIISNILIVYMLRAMEEVAYCHSERKSVLTFARGIVVPRVCDRGPSALGVHGGPAEIGSVGRIGNFFG